MLTGDLSITEGTAFLDGYDIQTNLREVCTEKCNNVFVGHVLLTSTRQIFFAFTSLQTLVLSCEGRLGLFLSEFHVAHCQSPLLQWVPCCEVSWEIRKYVVNYPIKLRTSNVALLARTLFGLLWSWATKSVRLTKWKKYIAWAPDPER